MLAGAAGHGYGSLDLFWFYKDGDGPFPKDGFQHWRKAIAYEGSRQVGLMRRLFEQRLWHKMVPDQSVIASEQGEGTRRLVAARAEDGSFVIAYTPVGQPVSIHMNKLNGSQVKAQWYDPRDGTWKAIGQYPNKGTALSIGKPNARIDFTSTNQPRTEPYLGPVGKPLRVEPLSALAYAAANAHTVLARRPEVDPARIGIVGHSFGGKWAMFASCLYDKFACAVWSDPGIVFDERDRRKQNPNGSVNYWDVWYLGFELGAIADPKGAGPFRKLPTEGQPRTGAYKVLVEGGHDLVELHALMAPRPFLVSGGTADTPERWPALNHAIAVNKLLGYDSRVALTSREGHTPTQAANEQVYHFFEWSLRESK